MSSATQAAILILAALTISPEDWKTENTDHFKVLYVEKSAALARSVVPTLEKEIQRVSAAMRVEPAGPCYSTSGSPAPRARPGSTRAWPCS